MIRWAGPERQAEPTDWLWLPALVVFAGVVLAALARRNPGSMW